MLTNSLSSETNKIFMVRHKLLVDIFIHPAGVTMDLTNLYTCQKKKERKKKNKGQLVVKATCLWHEVFPNNSGVG